MPLLAKVASIISNYFSCNMGFVKIDNSAIKSSLEGVRRQYLVGNLKLPQSLPYINVNLTLNCIINPQFLL